MNEKTEVAEPEDDEVPEEEVSEGAPAWLATFADLMSLLMCFFVLLLSFSEIDIQKYKQVAGSMKFAFGVQREIKADEIPKAESIVMREFNPGRPEPTVIKTIRQQTQEEMRRTPRSPEESNAASEALERLLARVREQLAAEIDDEALELFVGEGGVMIRVRERDAFPSGSASLQAGFKPVLDKLVTVLNGLQGEVVVAGHTDDVPIDTASYPSNWVLSSARAASVVHYLANAALDDPSRIEIRAYADTRPIVSNDTAANRARNRRVEINVNVDGAS